MLRLNATLRSVFIIAILFAPGFSTALQLSHNLPATEIPNPPAEVSFLVFDSADGALPIEVYDFPAGQYQLSPEADRVWIKAGVADELEPKPLWVELELDGAPKGERIPLATATSGVTFAAGNNLDMDGNAIINLTVPIEAGDAATKAYVDGANISGNAATATALAKNGTNCPSGEYARGVDENGNAEDCTTDQVGAGDNLGNHTATANIQLGNHWLSGDGGNEGIQVSDDGKVGIGSAPGSADLQNVGIDGVLFQGTYQSGSIPAEGAGTRFMWYPGKAALRVGYVDSTQWDDGVIGIYSTAMGVNTSASGSSSTAMGGATKASGSSSTAMGIDTKASGFASTAMGVFSNASGSASTAMGSSTAASGQFSTAMGENTTAESGYEMVVGRYNTDYEPISNLGWDSTDRLFVIGNGYFDSSTIQVIRSDAMVVLKSGDTTINGNATINGDVGQNLPHDGIVKAWAKITSSGSVVSCYNCDTDPSATLRVNNGNYQVAFTPLGSDISSRPRTATLDTHGDGTILGEIGLATYALDPAVISVRTANSAGTLTDKSFTVIVY